MGKNSSRTISRSPKENNDPVWGHSKMTISTPPFLPCHLENNRICYLKQWKSPFLLTSLPPFPGDVIFERPLFSTESPVGKNSRGFCGFAKMLEQCSEIVRRADRVGALPHAPLVRNPPKRVAQLTELISPLGTLCAGYFPNNTSTLE